MIALRERLICQSQPLSALDTQLGKTYEEKRAHLSPNGQKLLKRSERGWLSFTDTVCAETTDTADSRATSTACLVARYQDRLIDFAQVGVRLGPFVFNRIDSFAAEPHDVSDRTGHVAGFYVQHLAYPQIDNSSSVDARKWNKILDKGTVAHDDGCDHGLGDDQSIYKVTYATRHLISTSWVESTYCHGTPHGLFTVGANNLVLNKGARKLEAADLFGAEWEPKLMQLFRNALQAKGWQPIDNNARAEIDDDVVEPDQWSFTPAGLSVSFPAYAGGCYACNPGTTTVAWKDLEPLLKPKSMLQ